MTWINFGDVSPWHGQLWINNAHPDNDDDFAEVVQIIGPSDLESLAYNQLMIVQGSIYIPLHDKERVRQALDCIGVDYDDATWIDIALAFDAYHGVDQNSIEIVQIGKTADKQREYVETMQPDTVLAHNAKIENYLSRNQLS
jgi:hypothetical protein